MHKGSWVRKYFQAVAKNLWGFISEMSLEDKFSFITIFLIKYIAKQWHSRLLKIEVFSSEFCFPKRTSKHGLVQWNTHSRISTDAILTTLKDSHLNKLLLFKLIYVYSDNWKNILINDHFFFFFFFFFATLKNGFLYISCPVISPTKSPSLTSGWWWDKLL